MDSYSKGDVGQALKDAFMKCDEIITKPETVQEMKRMIMNTERYMEKSTQALVSSPCHPQLSRITGGPGR